MSRKRTQMLRPEDHVATHVTVQKAESIEQAHRYIRELFDGGIIKLCPACVRGFGLTTLWVKCPNCGGDLLFPKKEAIR